MPTQPVTRNVQRIGNSRGLILTSELRALGIDEAAEVSMTEDTILIRRANVAASTRPRIARNRQTFEDATEATLSQYETALARLGDAGETR